MLKRALAIAAIAFGAAIALTVWSATPWGSLRYIEKQANLGLPFAPANLSAFSDTETVETACMQLPRKTIDKLLRDRRFRSATRRPFPPPFPQSPSEFRNIEQLAATCQRLPAHAELYQAGACRDSIVWYALLDATSGQLWVQVEYPDMGGDLPFCGIRE